MVFKIDTATDTNYFLFYFYHKDLILLISLILDLNSICPSISKSWLAVLYRTKLQGSLVAVFYAFVCVRACEYAMCIKPYEVAHIGLELKVDMINISHSLTEIP